MTLTSGGLRHFRGLKTLRIDIIENVHDNRKARDVTRDIEKLIDNGDFKVKGWIISGDSDNRDKMVIPDDKYAATGKVPGVACNPVDDQFGFRVKLKFSERKRKLHTEPDLEPHQIPERIPANLTKRKILSKINSVYDPPGLAGPFTVRALLWASERKIDWGYPVPEEYIRDRRDVSSLQTQ